MAKINAEIKERRQNTDWGISVLLLRTKKCTFKESFRDQRWAWEESVRAEKRDRDAERERERDVSASTPSSVWSKLGCVRAFSSPNTKCTHTAQLRSDWWWRWRRNVSFSLSASLSLFSALTLSSHAHLWSLKLSLKMRVSSDELFSTLKKCTFFTSSEIHEKQGLYTLWLHPVHVLSCVTCPCLFVSIILPAQREYVPDCIRCGGRSFIPCLQCQGSKKGRRGSFTTLRCSACNQHGLQPCPDCTIDESSSISVAARITALARSSIPDTTYEEHDVRVQVQHCTSKTSRDRAQDEKQKKEAPAVTDTERQEEDPETEHNDEDDTIFTPPAEFQDLNVAMETQAVIQTTEENQMHSPSRNLSGNHPVIRAEAEVHAPDKSGESKHIKLQDNHGISAKEATSNSAENSGDEMSFI